MQIDRHSFNESGNHQMSRNTLYLVIGGLAVAVIIFGYQYYQSQQTTSVIEIGVGEGGISVKKK